MCFPAHVENTILLSSVLYLVLSKTTFFLWIETKYVLKLKEPLFKHQGRLWNIEADLIFKNLNFMLHDLHLLKEFQIGFVLNVNKFENRRRVLPLRSVFGNTIVQDLSLAHAVYPVSCSLHPLQWTCFDLFVTLQLDEGFIHVGYNF